MGNLEAHLREHVYLLVELRFPAFNFCMGQRLIKVVHKKKINNVEKQKIQAIRRNQVYFSSSTVSTDTTVIVKDYMLNEKFTFCFKITIKWNLTQSAATRLKSAKYKLM